MSRTVKGKIVEQTPEAPRRLWNDRGPHVSTTQADPPGKRPSSPLIEAPPPLPHGPHGLPRQFVAQNQRERLLVAMIAAVAAKGYQAVTVEDVVRRSGVSRKTFYEQFQNKEECFLAAWDAVFTRLLERIAEAYAAAEYWGAKAVGALGAILEFGASEPETARVALIEVMGAGPTARERYHLASYRLAALVGQAMEDSPFPPAQTQRAMLAAITGIAGIATELVREDRAHELPQIRDEAAVIGLSIFIGPEAAQRVVRRAAAELDRSAGSEAVPGG
jgi:AcrR family transcriptional regulator